MNRSTLLLLLAILILLPGCQSYLDGVHRWNEMWGVQERERAAAARAERWQQIPRHIYRVHVGQGYVIEQGPLYWE